MSDAIVVDSPIQNDSPLSKYISDHNLGPAAPAPAPQQVQTNDTTAPQVDAAALAAAVASFEPKTEVAAATTVAATSTDADRIKQLGDSIGLDLSRFPDVKSAEAAVTMMAEQYAKRGLGTTQATTLPAATAQQQSQTTATTAQVAAFPELDETKIEPSIVAAVKALKAQNEQLLASQAAQAKQHQDWQAQQQQAVSQEMDRRAFAFIDKSNVDKYGVAGKRSFMQEIATRNLLSAGAAIVNGIANTPGAKMPSPEDVMLLAMKLDGVISGSPTAPVVPQKPQPYSLPPTNHSTAGSLTGASLPRISPQNDPFKMMNDPTVQAIFREALKR